MFIHLLRGFHDVPAPALITERAFFGLLRVKVHHLVCALAK